MAIVRGQVMALDQTVEVVLRGVGEQAPRQLERAQHLGGECLAEPREFVLQKTVVEARVVGDENASRDPRRNLAGDVGKPRCVGDHRVGDAGERLNGGRDAAFRIDQATPFGGAAPVDPNDTDFGHPVTGCSHAGGFQVDEGDRVREHRSKNHRNMRGMNPT